MVTKWFDDFKIGEKSITRARTITETDVVSFAMLSGDWYPLHTDKEYVKKTPFGERIAHGMLVLSVMTGLVTLDPGYVLAFYGMDRVRFVRPTKIGDTIHVETVVTELTPRDETSGVVTFDVSVLNQNDKVVASTVMKMLVARKG